MLTVQVTGNQAVAGALGRLAADLSDLDALREAAEVGAQSVAAGVPRDTGALASSVRAETAGDNAAVIVVGGPTAPYAPYVRLYAPTADPAMTSAALTRLETEITNHIRTRGLT